MSPRGIGGAFSGTSDPTCNLVHETHRFLEACLIARFLVMPLAPPKRALLYQRAHCGNYARVHNAACSFDACLPCVCVYSALRRVSTA